MNIWDILILIMVAGLIYLAARLAGARKKKGGCGCGCANCPKRNDCNSKVHPAG